jgi:hypothetical protein
MHKTAAEGETNSGVSTDARDISPALNLRIAKIDPLTSSAIGTDILLASVYVGDNSYWDCESPRAGDDDWNWHDPI